MSRNRFAMCRAAFARRIALALTAGAAMSFPIEAQVLPQQPEEAQAWPEVETVRMLLRADAAAALADCRAPGICVSDSAAAPGPSAGRPPDDIRVAAIFGVARRLSAEVLVNGAMLRYQAGRAAPVAGAVFMAGGYQLLGIEGACVRLRMGGSDHTACLDAGKATP